MNAFVQCLNYDDVEKKRSGQRKIIFPKENLTGDGMQGIRTAIESWLMVEKKRCRKKTKRYKAEICNCSHLST
ncbi:unnamed protein product [Urochloa humidicola]